MRKHSQPHLNRSLRPSRTARSVTQDGFTLIELLLVIAIVASLTYLTAPAIMSLNQSGNFTSNTTEMSQILEQAYSSALSKNTYVWVGFSQLTIKGESGIAVASVYSSHEDPSDFPANVNLLTKPVFLPNLNLATVTTQITNPARATVSVGQITAADMGTFSETINGSPQTLSLVLKISPSGQLSTSSSNRYAWTEIGLTPLNSNGKNAAVLQMNAFTGRVSVYRP